MADAVLFRFAQEELVYLTRALKIAHVPGLDAHPLGNLDEDHQALALAVADRTLRSRGAVVWDGQEQRHVEPTVAGLVRGCAQPLYTLLLDLRGAEGPVSRSLFAFSSFAAIEHTLPEPGIHQFLAQGTSEDTLTRLGALLALPDAQPGVGVAGYVSRERLMLAERAPYDEAARRLGQELPRATAEGLAQALSAPQAYRHLALWKGLPETWATQIGQGNRQGTSAAAAAAPASAPAPRATLAQLTLAQGAAGLYLLRLAEPDATRVEVLPATGEQAWQAVERLLRPALVALPNASGVQIREFTVE